MPNVADLGKLVKQKYPEYGSIDDAELGGKVRAKYPEAYGHFGDMPQFETKLAPEEEAPYQAWKQKNAPADSGEDYDLRGLFKSGQGTDARGHATDQFKKPNHPTFSVESQYSTPENPGGLWAERDGKTFFTPSPANLKGRSFEDLQQYFKRNEPDATLVRAAGPPTDPSASPPPPAAAPPAQAPPSGMDQFISGALARPAKPAPNTGPPIDPANPVERLPTPEEATAQAAGYAKQYIDQVIGAGAPKPPNAIEQDGGGLPGSLRVGRGDAAMGASAEDFGGAGGKVPTPPGEFQDAVSAWGNKYFPKLAPDAPKLETTQNVVGRFLLNFVSPDSLGQMEALATGAEALPVLVNTVGKIAPVARVLKDLPALVRGLDVAAAGAIPGVVAGKGAAQIVSQGVPHNYGDALETGLNALLVGGGLAGAIKAGRGVMEAYPEAAKPTPAETKLAEETGGKPGFVKPEEAAQKAADLTKGGRHLAASQWKDLAENSPVDLGGGRRLLFDGVSANQRRFYRVVDADGKVLVAGPQLAVSGWLDQQKIARPSSEAGGSVSIGGGAAEPGELRQVEQTGQTRQAGAEPPTQVGEVPSQVGQAAETEPAIGETKAPAGKTDEQYLDEAFPGRVTARAAREKANGPEKPPDAAAIAAAQPEKPGEKGGATASPAAAETPGEPLTSKKSPEQTSIPENDDEEGQPTETLKYRAKGNDTVDVLIHQSAEGWTARGDYNLQGQAGGHIGDSGYDVYHPTRDAAVSAFLDQALRPGGHVRYDLDSDKPAIRARAQKIVDWLEAQRPAAAGPEKSPELPINAETGGVPAGHEMTDASLAAYNNAKKMLADATADGDKLRMASAQKTADFILELTKKSKAPALESRPKAPVTPQIPNEPGTKYVLPSFATSPGQRKPASADELAQHYTDTGTQPAPGTTATPEEIRAGAELAIERHNAASQKERKPESQPAGEVATGGESAAAGRPDDRQADAEHAEPAAAPDLTERVGATDTNQIEKERKRQAKHPMSALWRGQPKVPGTVQIDETGVTSSHAAEPADAVSPSVAARPADQKTLEGVPAEDVPGSGSERQADAERVRGAGADQGRAPRVASGEGAPAQPGVGDGSRGVRVPAEREGQAGSELRPGKSARPTPAELDHRITDDDRIGQGSPREKQRANVEAIRTLKKVQAEKRPATDEEKKTLVRYSGWGAHAHVFDAFRTEHRQIREGLEELLTPDEYKSIRATTPNAHYTRPEVIEGIWKAAQRLGFKKGRVLEPALGVGHFFGLEPAELLAATSRTGVEIDPITAGIAKLLYPASDIQALALEKTSLPDNFYDLAVGNVPFGNYGVYDSKLKGKAPRAVLGSIHNYFFAKALDKVRPGGIIAFVTSSFTMDQRDSTVRAYLAERADLVGAIRLPSSTFTGNAGTDVTTDIIILQKRAEGQAPAGQAWEKIEPFKGQVPVEINEYYVANPKMMLGQMAIERGSYAEMQRLVGEFSRDALDAAIAKLPENILKPFTAPKRVDEGIREQMDADQKGAIKQGAFALKDGKLYVREGEELVAVGIGKENTARVTGMMRVRDAIRDVFRTQINEDGDRKIAEARARLNSAYDGFVAKHGFLSERTNSKAFSDDPDSPLLLSLEHWDEDTKRATKAKIFTERTLPGRYKPVDKAGTAAEAMAIALNETGVLDFDRMSQLTGLEPEHLQTELGPLIYKNPNGEQWETADEYLSGNVREKLAAAEAAAAVDPAYERNVTELKAAQPLPLGPGDINARLGAPWIPGSDIAQFIREEVTGGGQVTVFYSPVAGAWSVNLNRAAQDSAGNQTTWGAGGLTGAELVAMALNLKIPTIKKNIGTSSDPQIVVDQDATALAREKLQNLKDKFATEWVWKDTDRADRLATKYNVEFNSTRERVFDGSHLTFPGSANVTLRKHQKNAVWRILRSTGNTLLAHVVGAGKTYEMVGAAMELRRLGLARKPMIAVPNHLVGQIGAEFLQMYPTANVFIAGEDTFSAGNRQKAMSRIATGNYDAVIVGHNSFGSLPVSDETYTTYLQEQLDELVEAIEDMTRQAGKKDRTVKELEKAKKRLEAKIEERSKRETKDNAITWEEMGVDHLFVDEADLFKNLFFVTKMTRIAGLPNSESDRAFDMFIKTQYLQRMNNGRGITFATGTPIANTIAELYTMQRYLQMPWLKEHGVAHFDAWAASYGDSVTSMETAPDGSGMRMNTRFARFVNVPELRKGFGEVADIQTAKMLQLPTPKLIGGKNRGVAAKATEELKEFVQTLVKRSEAIKTGSIDPKVDNMLKITSEGRKAALDMRLVGGAGDHPGNKINLVVGEVFQIWKEGTPKKLTQLIFIDLSTPPPKGQRGPWNAYEEIKAKLVARGVPAAEIAFIQHYNKAEKLSLFHAVSAGRIRILLGSTEMMGAGTNVQRLLVAEHHVDVPWRPRDLEQREGRILRQGNTNDEVHIINYVTEGSFDTYMYQTVESKAIAIEQFMNGDPAQRTIEDVSSTALTAAEIKAISSGNPLILEKAKIDAEVNRLSRLVAAYRNEQAGIRRQIADLPDQIRNTRKMVGAMESDIEAAADAGEMAFTIGKKLYAGEGARKAAGAALHDFLDRVREDKESYKLGTYGPFELRSSFNVQGHVEVEGDKQKLVHDLPGVTIHRQWEYRANTNQDGDPVGTIASIEAVVRNFPSRITIWRDDVEQKEKKLADLEGQLGKPNAHGARLEELAKRQAEIFAALDLNKGHQGAAAPEAAPDSNLKTSAKDLLSEETGAVSLNVATLGLREFFKQDVHPALIEAAKLMAGAKDDILRLVAPAARGPLAGKTQGEIRYQAAELQRKMDRAEAALEKASKELLKLPIADRFDFIDRIETGLPQPSLALQAIADIMRQMLDAARDEVQNLGTGKLENFYENYFPHIWKDPKGAAVTIAAALAKRPLEGRKSFLKKRTIVTIADGLAAGLVPISNDPVELVLAKLAEMNKYIMARHLLEQAKTMGVVKFGRGGSKPKAPGDWRKIDDAIATVFGPRTAEGSQTVRGHYWALEPAATLINNYLSPGLRQYASYRAYMGLGNVMLQFQLGWSAFHGTFVSLEAMTSRLSLGLYQMNHGDKAKGLKSIAVGLTPVTPFTTYQAGKRITEAWRRPGTQSPLVEQMADAVVQAGGRAFLPHALETKMTKQMVAAFHAGNVVGAALRIPFAATEQLARPIMQYLVPRMKLGVFAQMAQYELERAGPGATPEQIREALQRSWDSVDNRMGQLVYDNLGWNRVVKDLAMGSVRTVGWNLGDIRELGGGALDLGKGAIGAARGRGFELTPRASYLPALGVLIGLYGGVMYWLLNGRPPRELLDYYYPEDGQGNRLSMPSYIKEIVSVEHDPVGWAKGKLHPLLTLFVDTFTNRDYFNRPIAHSRDLEGLLELAKHAVSTFEPISIQGLERNSDETLKQKVLPFVGFPRAPKYIGADEGTSGSADLLGTTRAPRPGRDAELDRLLGR